MGRNGVDYEAAQRILTTYGQPVTRHRDHRVEGRRGQTGRFTRLPYDTYYLSDFRVNLSLHYDVPSFIVLHGPVSKGGRLNKYF